MYLNDSIYLCTRSDMDVLRHFDGIMAHLALFDEALSAHEVAALYATYVLNGERLGACSVTTTSPGIAFSNSTPRFSDSSIRVPFEAARHLLRELPRDLGCAPRPLLSGHHVLLPVCLSASTLAMPCSRKKRPFSV
jgi:hypothetical protein